MAEDDDRREEMEEEEPPPAGGPRPMWSGTLTFGLVSVPVVMLAAVRKGGIPLRMLDVKARVPLQRRYYCPVENVEVHPEHIQRGYELEDGRFVIVRDEELAALEPRKSRDIDLRQFVKRDELEPLLFERSYYLTPGGGASKAYHLLTRTLQETGRAGIATFVMRGKEYLAAILAEQGVLRVQTLRFNDEIRDPAKLGLPARHEPDKDAVQRFAKAIKDLTKPQLKLEDLADEQTRRLLALVEQKDRREQDVVQVEEPETGEAPLQDLMAALQRSLDEAGASEPAPRGKSAKPKPAVEVDIDAMSAGEVKQHLDELDTRQLRRLRQHEDRHKHRKTVLEALDRQLRRRGAA